MQLFRKEMLAASGKHYMREIIASCMLCLNGHLSVLFDLIILHANEAFNVTQQMHGSSQIASRYRRPPIERIHLIGTSSIEAMTFCTNRRP